MGALGAMSQTNPGVNLPGSAQLTALAGNNAGTNNSGSPTLQNLANSNAGANNPFAGKLQSLSSSNQAMSQPGTGTMASLMGTNYGLANPGTSPLEQYAGGGNLLQNNALVQGAMNSALSTALPQIESQFVNGNGMTNPASEYAASQGAMTAIAPLALQAAQQEEQNQLGAAGQLSQNTLTGAGQQGQLSTALANLGLGGAQLQGGLASNLYSGFLTGAQQQQGAAQDIAANSLAGAQLQQQAAATQNADALQGAGLQQGAATNLANLGLSGVGAQTTAANSLANLGLSGAQIQGSLAGAAANLGLGGTQLQSGAANNLLNSYLGAGSALNSGALEGGNLQASAAQGISQPYQQTLGNMVQGNALAPSTQQMAYTDPQALMGAGTAEQLQQQQQINAAMQQFNYYQQLPYQQLNQYLSSIQGNYGNQTTQPYFQNQGANTLSGMLSGGLLASSLYNNYNNSSNSIPSSVFVGPQLAGTNTGGY
jgi:hypothetical protein